MEYQHLYNQNPETESIFADEEVQLPDISLLEKIYIFWVLLLSVSATPLTRSFDPRDNMLGVSITLLLTISVCIKHKIKISSTLIYIFGALAIWTGIHLFFDETFKVLEYATLFLKVFIAYVTVYVFKEELWGVFHDTVYKLSIIDLGFWVLQGLAGTSVMSKLAPLPSTGTSLGSFLIYSVSNNEIYEGLGLFGLLRNAGFCWEPGFYACVLVFAIFANFIIYDNTWRGNKELYVLIAALITTASTTGYAAFFIFIVTTFIFRNKQMFNENNIVAIILSLLSFGFVMQLPFMQEKIQNKSDSQNFITEQKYGIKALEKSDKTFTVDRFEGMNLDLLNIRDKPWIGYGTLTNSFVYNKLSENIRISNGISSIPAIYGVPFAIVIIILLIYNSLRLRKEYPSCQSPWLILFLATSISYNFLNFPLYIAFSLFCVLKSEEEDCQEEDFFTEEIEYADKQT